jgi:2-methylcitrate dehydratase PrpD
MSSASERIASFAVSLTADDLSADVVWAAKLHALDTLGCGIAAAALGEAAYAAASALEVAGQGSATAIGILEPIAPSDAAFVNGTLCHALDFDDTHPHSIVHVSASVVPAALAAAQAHEASGADVVVALVAGSETSIRLGMAAGGAFHARGLHPTGVCGVFGATVAAARLRGLDARQTANALGLAGSMASGLLEFLADGSETKRLHPGFAAQAGLAAARLAAHGATGPATVLEGRFGLFNAYLHGVDADVAGQVADLGERWETPRIAFKPYPACHYVHAPVDALAQLVAEHGLGVDDVERLVAFSDATGESLVLHPLADKIRPRTVYDAKFSLPYCLAALLVHGRLDVTSFTRAAIADPEVLDVARRVDYEVKEYSPAPDAFSGGVRVQTRDGRTLEAELRHQRGGSENPLTVDDVVEKYRANALLGLEERDVSTLESAVLALEGTPDLSVAQLLARVRSRSLTHERYAAKENR